MITLLGERDIEMLRNKEDNVTSLLYWFIGKESKDMQ